MTIDSITSAPMHAGGRGHCAIHQSAQNFRAQTLQLEGFSVERLMTFLTALGSEFEIRVHFAETIFLARKNFGQCRLSDFRENAALIRSVPRSCRGQIGCAQIVP
jgi:hypothetical protein